MESSTEVVVAIGVGCCPESYFLLDSPRAAKAGTRLVLDFFEGFALFKGHFVHLSGELIERVLGLNPEMSGIQTCFVQDRVVSLFGTGL